MSSIDDGHPHGEAKRKADEAEMRATQPFGPAIMGHQRSSTQPTISTTEMTPLPPAAASTSPSRSTSLASLYALPPRHNGLEPPWHPSQVMVWAAVLITLAVFFGLCLPFIPDDADGPRGRSTEYWVVLALYLGLALVGLPCYVVIQRGDPGLTPEEARPYAETGAPDKAGMPLARVCQTCNLWMGPRTKHCHMCRKCIDGFDHHVRRTSHGARVGWGDELNAGAQLPLWLILLIPVFFLLDPCHPQCVYLNTCIGRKNYRLFMIMLTCAFLLLALQLYVALSLLVRAGLVHSDVLDKISESALDTRLAFIPLLSFLSVVPTLAWLLVLSLWAFHLYIIARGLSTLDWIMERRKVAAEKEEKAQEVHRVRCCCQPWSL